MWEESLLSSLNYVVHPTNKTLHATQASDGGRRRGTGRSPILVVAPSSVQKNWLNEMSRWGASSTGCIYCRCHLTLQLSQCHRRLQLSRR